MAPRQRERPPRPTSDYEVGYGKPPPKHQFKKGQSGNPKGRPKGSRSLDTIIMEKLDERVTYTLNGKRKTATRREVFGERLISDALSGKPAAAKMLLQLEAGLASEKEGGAAQVLSLEKVEELDRAILKSAKERGYIAP